jgi:hypothetical protein
MSMTNKLVIYIETVFFNFHVQKSFSLKFAEQRLYNSFFNPLIFDIFIYSYYYVFIEHVFNLVLLMQSFTRSGTFYVERYLADFFKIYIS